MYVKDVSYWDGNTLSFHPPGIVFRNKGKQNYERQSGNLYDNKRV